MPRVIRLIREHLEQNLLLSKPPPTTLWKSQNLNKFYRLMCNRLLMGAFRYELMEEKKEGEYAYAAAAIAKLKQYQKTLNTELLVDAANYCGLEFKFGNPKRHFSAQDDSDHIQKVK